MSLSTLCAKFKFLALRSPVPGIARAAARVIRWKHKENWPISARTGIKPQHWRGWPEGKRFAVVFTHDVLTSMELEGIPQVVDVEKRAGFRSAFFVLPEACRPQRGLLDPLSRDGFEVGLHGAQASRAVVLGTKTSPDGRSELGSWISEWAVTGHRSTHQTDDVGALHSQGVRYDCSNHDSDPFKSSCGAVSTIFPFWLQDERSERGVIELPCTLAEPRTLLTLLAEGDIAIWKQKVDWIAERGGMVLLNAPLADLSCGDASSQAMDAYRRLLEYISTRYAGEYWHGVPKQVAEYCAAVKPLRTPLRHRRVCMLAYAQTESDHRILRYANALAERGDEVDILSLGGETPPLNNSYFGSVWVRHLQTRDYSETSKWDYLLRILTFTVRSFVVLSYGLFRRRYDLIHVHNIPDFLVFSALIPRLTGTRIILDIHDLLPEFYECKFNAKGPLAEFTVECLRFVEKASAALSNHVIIANHLWYHKLIHRTVTPDRCTPFINYIDLSTFGPRRRERVGGPFRIIFPGGLQWHQGLDIGIRAFKDFHARFPNSEFHIYGQGNEKSNLIALAEELGLSKVISFFPGVSASEIPGLIADSDLGVVPKRADSFGNEAYSTKIMEYMSQGLPVAVSKTKVDQHYFSETDVFFFTSGSTTELAEAMWVLATDTSKRQHFREAGLSYVRQNNWEVKKLDYLALVDDLLGETETPRQVDQERDAA
jgi:glycosyltransferase involved in cell wall biosynthesis/peptidoglycan/xylan/chitin deacetylase (PgdA/CDA1 family)